MIILKHYRIVNRNGIFYVISKKPHRCPCCQGPLKVRDSRPRQLILSDETMTFQLRRQNGDKEDTIYRGSCIGSNKICRLGLTTDNLILHITSARDKVELEEIEIFA